MKISVQKKIWMEFVTCYEDEYVRFEKFVEKLGWNDGLRLVKNIANKATVKNLPSSNIWLPPLTTLTTNSHPFYLYHPRYISHKKTPTSVMLTFSALFSRKDL